MSIRAYTRAFISDSRIDATRKELRLPQRSPIAAELRRHIEFQEQLKDHVAPALVDGVIALLAIQLRELEATQPTIAPQALPAPPSAQTAIDSAPAPLTLDASLELALVQLLMGVVTADGLTKNVELRKLRWYFESRPDYQSGDLARINELIQYVVDGAQELDVATLAQPFIEKSYEERLTVYAACVAVAFSDDELVDEETELLGQLALLFGIDSAEASRLADAQQHESLGRQQEVERRQKGQFPTQAEVRFHARPEDGRIVETQTATISPAPSLAEVKPEQPPSSVPQQTTETTPATAAPVQLPAPAPEPHRAAPPPALEPDPAVISRTMELMAIYLCDKRGQAELSDSEWNRLLKSSPALSEESKNVLQQSTLLKAQAPGTYELARPLTQRETIEARIFGALMGSTKPVSARLLTRTQGGNPEKTLQIVLKIARECPAFICYGYGCGTWFGLAAWGRQGHEEAVRQNLTPIKKQLQDAGKSSLSDYELSIVRDVATAVRDRALVELAS